MDWHHGTCRKLDLFECDGIQSCLGCGLSATITKHSLPPIRQERSEFRLLRLERGSFVDEVQCFVSVEDFNSDPEYVALSYTWADDNGDDSRCETILVNDEPFAVTKNCKLALRRARSKLRIVTIWVDAICIDQNNDAERGHQVKLMPQIYFNAKKVFIYVGEATKDSNHLFKELNRSNITWHADEAIVHTVLSTAAVQSIFSRRYFTRIWILQEVALAKTAILVCGGDSFPWSHFVLLARQATTLKQRPPALDFNKKLFLIPGKELELLDLGRLSQATNPLDKVYAILGLLRNRRIGRVEADYTLSIAELYGRVASELATSYGWSRVLERAGTRHRMIQAVPSWAPDWSFNEPIVLEATKVHKYYKRDHWVRYEPASDIIHIMAALQRDFVHGGGAANGITRHRLIYSSQSTRPSSYLRIGKSDNLATLARYKLGQLSAARQASCTWHNAGSQKSLVLDLQPSPDGGAWTLWMASWEEEEYLYIPFEDMYELFLLSSSEFMSWDIVTLIRETRLAEPLSSTMDDPKNDFASIMAGKKPGTVAIIRKFAKKIFGRGGESHSSDSPSISEANSAFFKFLEDYYLVKEEWIEVH